MPLNIFVLDDGDTRWALYKATTAGVGATFVKISDPDLLNAVVSAATILATILTGLDTGSATVVTAADNILSAIGKLQAQISAEQAARQAAISAVNIAILAGDQANGAAIASEETDRIAADAALQTQINQLPKFQKVPFTLIDNRHIELNNAVTNIMISKNGITLDDQAPASDFTYNDIVEVEFNEELMDDDIIVVRGNYYLAP